VHKPVTKSTAGSRSIDLDGHTRDALREWLLVRDGWKGELALPDRAGDVQAACERGHGGRGHPSFLFTWPDGRHLNPDWISHEFARLCEVCELPRIRLHDVRHTYAPEFGEHLKVVQERLGWASAAFMLKTYTHLVPGMQRDAAQRFADRIFGAGEADAAG
jgi:integrase